MDSLVARFGLGFRIHYRNYRQYTVTGGYSMSPSSFVSNEFTYDGLITSKELKFGMPMSVWFRISPRSRVYACLEFQVAIARGFFEEGTATTTTTHYGLPDYQPVSVTVKDEPYERHIPIKTSVGSRFAGSLGYRFRFNDRFMVGPDAALVVDPLWSEAGDTLVRELSFSFVWTFNTPDGTSTR